MEEIRFLRAENAALRAEIAEKMNPKPCIWTYCNDGDMEYWDTSCDNTFMFDNGGPEDNHAKFCLYCGRPIEVEIADPDDAEEVSDG